MTQAHTIALAFAALALSCLSARAEVTECIEIVSVPATITQQGVHCLKQDLAYGPTSGTAITINTNNVTIDMNGYKLGGLAGGLSNAANGIYASARLNITVRNGTIRGFGRNVFLSGSGHIVEDIRSESARISGISISGDNSVVRNNLVTGAGGGGYSTAWGITLQFGSGSSVMDNIITGVSASTNVYGIFSTINSEIIIERNQIRGLSGQNTFGIYFSSDDGSALVRDNVVWNRGTTGTGIGAYGTSSACIDNLVKNFTTAVSGCSVNEGNRAF